MSATSLNTEEREGGEMVGQFGRRKKMKKACVVIAAQPF